MSALTVRGMTPAVRTTQPRTRQFFGAVPREDLGAVRSRLWIVAGLLEMRRAGLFVAVYCDAERLAVVLPTPEDKRRWKRGEAEILRPEHVQQRIGWDQALEVVNRFRKEKRSA